MSTNITAKYAIKYFRDNNFYVIWHRNIRNTAGKLISRQYFSVNADDVREIDYNGTVIKKARGDKEQETVYVCKAENILKYLQELTKQ
ncbi:MAG: hypothetical protein IJT49_06530 [Clostridia bacterium]|nr:hypothetical protein [Clostridia bacterium]